MNKKHFLFLSLLCLYLTALSVSIFGQGTTSRVTGTVTDNVGAAVSGATVTLTNESTGVTLTTQTNDSGVYTFDLIQAGTYSLAVERQGFKRFVSTRNTVNINQPATINVSLEVGDVSATVTVESAVEQVQTSTSGNVGSIIEQRTLESLPIVGARGRNPLDLLNYQPGVVVGSNTGGGVHVHGSRDRAFNFTLDGIDINESTAGGSNFTPLRPNPDSLQEFQIVTSNFTAELGRSSGAQVTLVTRSGTNQLRGSVFDYYQTPEFHANEAILNLQGIPKRQFVQHIFGGSVGGPLVVPGFGEGGSAIRVLRDRAFFFTNLQMLRANETRLQTSTVYTESARNGIFRYVEGGRNAPAGTSVTSAFPTGAAVNADGSPRYPACGPGVPLPCIRSYDINTGFASMGGADPFIRNVLRAMPLPNDFSLGDGLNTARYNFVAPQIEKQYDFTVRFDFKVNDNNQLYLRYAQGEQNTFGDIANAGLQRFPGLPNWIDTFRTPKNLAINYRWSPSAKLTNEFIFGINRFGFKFEYPASNPAHPFILNIPTDPDRTFRYNARSSRTYQFVDNITYDLSPHILKFGINFRFGNQFDDRSSAGGQVERRVFFGTGSSNFTGFGLPTAGATSINTNDLSTMRSVINDIIGRIGSVTQGFVADPNNPNQFAPAGTRWLWTAYYPEYDFYVQDTWRFRQNLTFDLGLRWEIKMSPTSKDLPVLVPNQPFTVGSSPSNSLRWVEGDLFKNDYDNFSPSVGFAWDPFKTGKTSVRANYRLAYDRFPSQVFANFVFQSAPGNTFESNPSGIGSQNLLIRNGIPDVTPTLTPTQLRQPPAFSTSTINVVDPDMKFAETHQWFAGVQREIWGKNVVEVNYIGRRSVNLFGAYDVNQVDIFARDPRCPENFLQAFNTVRASTTANSCLINLMFTGNPNNNAGTTTFRSLPAVQTALAPQPANNRGTGGGVGAAAAAVSQRTCQAADVTAGICTATGLQLLSQAFGNPFFFQRYPQFSGALNVLDSNDFSRYNGLEVIVRRRFSEGFSYQLSYTWSMSKDTRSFDPTFATADRGTAQSASSTPFNIFDRRANYSWSDFDRRHVLQGYWVFDVPFGRGRAFGSNMPKVLDFIVGGWQLSGSLLWGSGRPFTVYSNVNTFSNVVSSTANCNGCPRNMGRLQQREGTTFWFSEEDVNRFSVPNPGEQGNTPRNYFIGPRQFQANAALKKKFRFTERYSFDLGVESTNVTNNTNWLIPVATATASNLGSLRTSLSSTGSRKIQFSGRLNF